MQTEKHIKYLTAELEKEKEYQDMLKYQIIESNDRISKINDIITFLKTPPLQTIK